MAIDRQAEKRPTPWIITVKPIQLDTSAVEGFPPDTEKIAQ